MSIEIFGGFFEGIPEDISAGITRTFSERILGVVPGEITEGNHSRISETTPAKMPEDILSEIPNGNY